MDRIDLGRKDISRMTLFIINILTGILLILCPTSFSPKSIENL